MHADCYQMAKAMDVETMLNAWFVKVATTCVLQQQLQHMYTTAPELQDVSMYSGKSRWHRRCVGANQHAMHNEFMC